MFDRTTKMFQHLNGDELKKNKKFIKSLDATNTDKLPTLSTSKKTSSQMDLSQQAITPSTILSVGLQYVGFDSRRQASASKDLNIERFISFYGAPPEALAPLFRENRNMFQEDNPMCRNLLI